MSTTPPPTIQAVNDINHLLGEFFRSDSCIPLIPPLSLPMLLPTLVPVLTNGPARRPSCDVQLLVAQWRDSMVELCTRLCVDWPQVVDTFCALRTTDKLTGLRRVGDPHANGRAVLILEFGSGERLVYKPRCLEAESRYHHLQAWLNEHGDHPPLCSPRILAPTDEYAWMQFLPHRTCTDEQRLQRFFRRAAADLALLQLIQATDCHCQNLIAFGEHPVVVDLEALFQPRFVTEEAKRENRWSLASLDDSVERVALLPGSSRSHGQDISGLGPPALSSPHSTATSLYTSSHLPTLNGDSIELARYCNHFTEQFAATYRLLVGKRKVLQAESGLLASFSDVPIRIILRHSRDYADMLSRMTINRTKQIESLLAASVVARPYLRRVIPLEIQALRRRDIPLFLTKPDSRDIWTNDGCRIPNFLNEPGLQLARRRLQCMNEFDLAKQLTFIRHSIVGGRHSAAT